MAIAVPDELQERVGPGVDGRAWQVGELLAKHRASGCVLEARGMAIAVLDELQERGTEALYGHGLMDCRIMRKSETLLYGGKISDSFDLFTGRESNSAGGHVTDRAFLANVQLAGMKLAGVNLKGAHLAKLLLTKQQLCGRACLRPKKQLCG